MPYGVSLPYDRYKIDSEGNVTPYYKKGGDQVDYLMNESGVDIQIKDTSILPELHQIKGTSTSVYHGPKRNSFAIRGEQSQDDMFKIFNFAANNSSVEWSIYRADVGGSTAFGLGTYHNRTVSPGASLFDNNEIISGVHSHPNVQTTINEEIGSVFGDRMNTQTFKPNYYKYVYFPNSGRLWDINNQNSQPSYIRHINRNHRRFYFGTLNSN